MRAALLFVLLLPIAAGSPTVAFPFNSQVPSVARVAQPYYFQFAAATFQSDASNLTYGLVGAPGWLALDGPTRTLSGSPAESDKGANTFSIKASDETGSVQMACTLVVTDEPGPRMAKDVGLQLAQAGQLAAPDTLSLHPGDAFAIAFAKTTFESATPIAAYYATMIDHTPLASWIAFDSATLSFFGLATPLNVESQSFEVSLVATDVIGFAGATASFTLLVEQRKLAFEPQEEVLNITAGSPINDQALMHQLNLNGVPIAPTQIKSVTSSMPNWLSLNQQLLSLSGTPPPKSDDQDISITVQDIYGDTAVKTLRLQSQGQVSSLFSGAISNMTATVGEQFTYSIPQSLFDQFGLNISASIPSTSSWLSFNSASLLFQGTPPIEASNTVLTITVSATSPGGSTEAQSFSIEINKSRTTTTSASATAIPRATWPASSSPAPTGHAMDIENQSRSHLSPGAIAGIVIGCLVTIFLLFLLAVALCRCTRREKPRTPSKRDISYPGDPKHLGWQSVDEEGIVDTNKRSAIPRFSQPPPRVEMNLSHSPLKDSRLINRASMASSLGNGEMITRADDNIPMLGEQMKRSRHDSYSAAASLSHTSNPGLATQYQRSSWKRLSNRHSPAKVGLGIDLDSQQGSVLRQASSRGDASRSRLSASHGPSTMRIPEDDDVAALTNWESGAAHPRNHNKRSSRSLARLSFIDAWKRRSIRLVDTSDHLPDNRTFDEKRQSYIHNRASTGVPSPLFATNSRSSEILRFGKQRSSTSDTLNKVQGKRPSASSSLEPPARKPRRLASDPRTVFAPDFPRAVRFEYADAASMEPSEPIPDDGSSDWSTDEDTASEDQDPSWRAEAGKPRHERTFVFPGEASPTPPPAVLSASSSVVHHRVGGAGGVHREAARQRLARRLQRDSSGNLAQRSSSALARHQTVPGAGRDDREDQGFSIVQSIETGNKRQSMREPLKMISNDSVSRARMAGNKGKGMGLSDKEDHGRRSWSRNTHMSGTGLSGPPGTDEGKGDTGQSDGGSASKAFM